MEKALAEVKSQLKKEIESCADKNIQIKTLEELDAQRKIEVETIKQNLHGFHVEDTTKKIQALEKSAKKVKQRLAYKIYSYDEDNEDLELLLKLDASELFSRFEKNIKIDKDTDRLKLEEITGALSDMKIKLTLQTEKREAYEKQHNEMIKILSIRDFSNIIPSIKSLLEKNETNLYSNAQVIIESSLKEK